MHRPAGNFCVGTYKFGHTTPGMGKMYRGTIMGPGVTPIVRVKVPEPGPYDPAADADLEPASRRRWRRPATPATTLTDARTGSSIIAG